MSKNNRILKCYISSLKSPLVDPYLENLGFTNGMVVFAIPDYGILFRCRVKGEELDLEFGSFFALLGFIKTRLKDQNIKAIQVMSSNPYFVFSFSGNKDIINKNKERLDLLNSYRKIFSLTIAYIKPIDNMAMLSTSDCASLPLHKKIAFKPDMSESKKIKIMPFNQGLSI